MRNRDHQRISHHGVPSVVLTETEYERITVLLASYSGLARAIVDHFDGTDAVLGKRARFILANGGE